MKNLTLILILLSTAFSQLVAQTTAVSVGKAPMVNNDYASKAAIANINEFEAKFTLPAVAYAGNGTTNTYSIIDLTDATMDSVNEMSTASFPMSEEFDGTSTYRVHENMTYGTVSDSGYYTSLGTLTGDIINVTPSALAYDHENDIMYLCALNSNTFQTSICTVDMSTGIFTSISTSPIGAGLMAMDFARDGMLYGPSIFTDSLYQIDPTTGILTEIGPIGIDISYGQDVSFDLHENKLYTVMYSIDSYAEFGYYDITSGAYTTIASAPEGQFATFVITNCAPYHVTLLPSDMATEVALDAVVTAEFNANIFEDHLFATTILPDPGNVSASITDNKVTIVHDDFAYDTEYTVTIPAGALTDHESDLTYDVVWTFTTLDCSVDPSDVDISGITTNSATIGWTENGLASEWNVVIGNEGFDPETEGSSITVNDDPGTELTGLNPGTDYEAYIQAVCSPEDLSSLVGPYEFTTGGTNSVDLAISNDLLKLYPNPSTGHVYIAVNEKSSIRLIDISGRTIKEFMLNAHEEISFNQSSGIYVVQLETKEGSYSYKLIVE